MGGTKAPIFQLIIIKGEQRRNSGGVWGSGNSVILLPGYPNSKGFSRMLRKLRDYLKKTVLQSMKK